MVGRPRRIRHALRAPPQSTLYASIAPHIVYIVVSDLDILAGNRRSWRGIDSDQEEREPLFSRGAPEMAEEDERYRLDQRIDHVTNESLDATRRIRQVAEETNQMGVDTLITLNEQGEQLDNVERRLDDVNVDLKQTDRNLTRLEACCGCCSCPCGPRSAQSTRTYKKAYGRKARQMEDVVSEQPRSSGGGGGGQPQGPFIKRVTDDEREDQMEDNLQAVSSVLTNLKGIASEMGTELDRQNNQLDRINRKADANITHLETTNRRIARQL